MGRELRDFFGGLSGFNNNLRRKKIAKSQTTKSILKTIRMVEKTSFRAVKVSILSLARIVTFEFI